MKKTQLYTQTQKFVATTLLFGFSAQSCTSGVECLRAGEGALAQTNHLASAPPGLNNTNLPIIQGNTPNASIAIKSYLIERAKRLEVLRGNSSYPSNYSSKATAETLDSMGFSRKKQPDVYKVLGKALEDRNFLADIKAYSPLWEFCIG